MNFYQHTWAFNSYLVIANNDVSSNVQYNLRKTIGQKNMIVSCKQILICNNHHNPNSLKCDEWLKYDFWST